VKLEGMMEVRVLIRDGGSNNKGRSGVDGEGDGNFGRGNLSWTCESERTRCSKMSERWTKIESRRIWESSWCCEGELTPLKVNVPPTNRELVSR